VPEYRVTVVCSCDTRNRVILGTSGTCQCGRPYDTGKLPADVVEQIQVRATSYRAKRRLYAIQLGVVFLAILVIAKSAPWPVTVGVIFVSWLFFGWRGVRQLRRTDHEVTRHPI
jgi:hypothetical protein